MAKLFTIAVVIADILAISDVLMTFRAVPPRVAWIALILLLPVAGALAWYFFQHVMPRWERGAVEGRRTAAKVARESEKIR